MKRALLLFALTSTAFAVTVYRVDPSSVMTTAGNAPSGGYPALHAVAGAQITVCTDIACTITAPTYTDATGNVACPPTAQVTVPGIYPATCTPYAGNQGQFGFWIPAGTYYYKITLTTGQAYGGYPFTSGGGPGASTAPTLPFVVSTDYDFAGQTCNSSNVCAVGGISGASLVVGNNAITMVPVPAGVNGSDTNHYLYLFGGSYPQACLITGGSGTAGQASGQIIINCPHAATGSFLVGSATSGIEEALYSHNITAPPVVYVPPGTFDVWGTITLPLGTSLIGPNQVNAYGSLNWHATDGSDLLILQGSNVVRDLSLYAEPGAKGSAVQIQGSNGELSRLHIYDFANNSIYPTANVFEWRINDVSIDYGLSSANATVNTIGINFQGTPGGSGTATRTGTSVSWVSGSSFNVGWASSTIVFPSGTYIISTVNSPTSLTLQWAPGTTESSASYVGYSAGPGNFWIDNLTIFGPTSAPFMTAGVLWRSGGGIYIDNSYIVNAGLGLAMVPLTPTLTSNIIISNTAVDSSGGDPAGVGLQLTPYHANAIINSIFFHHGKIMFQQGKAGVLIGGSGTVTLVNLSDNEIAESAGPGIFFGNAGTTDLRIHDNRIYGNGTAPSGGYRSAGIQGDGAQNIVQIHHNVIGHGSQIGIWGSQTPTPETQQYGMYFGLGNNANNWTIDNNDVSGNLVAGIFDLPTGANNVFKENPGYNPVGAQLLTGGTACTSGAACPVIPSNSSSILYFTGGTVSSVTRGGVTVCTASPCSVSLPPLGQAVPTWSSAPTIALDVQ